MQNELITVFKGVRLIFKNFKGERSTYNTEGSRSFNIPLDHELAAELVELGYNVRYPKPNPKIDPEQDTRLPRLEVTVSSEHDFIKPNVRIFMVDGDNVTRIPNNDLKQIDMLDSMALGECDIQVNPYRWVMDKGTDYERSGIKCYLASAYLTIDNRNVDAFASKYGTH